MAKWLKGVLLGILVAVGGWALFKLALLGMNAFLLTIGIENEVYGYVAIVIIVVIAMVIGWGTGLKGAIKKLVS